MRRGRNIEVNGGMMGANLKIKDQIRYSRKHPRGKCGTCNELIPDVQLLGFAGVGVIGRECRCRVIGLGSSRLYRIDPTAGCDRHDDDSLHQLASLGPDAFKVAHGDRKFQETIRTAAEKERFLAGLKAKEIAG